MNLTWKSERLTSEGRLPRRISYEANLCPFQEWFFGGHFLTFFWKHIKYSSIFFVSRSLRTVVPAQTKLHQCKTHTRISTLICISFQRCYGKCGRVKQYWPSTTSNVVQNASVLRLPVTRADTMARSSLKQTHKGEHSSSQDPSDPPLCEWQPCHYIRAKKICHAP